MKINLKFFIPLFLFIEDLWPYQFHGGITYTPFMEACMEEMEFLNYIRLDPTFMKPLQIQDRIFRKSKEKN